MAKASREMPTGADGRRGSPLHPLHLRHDGKAEGHPAHDGRLPRRRRTRRRKWVFDLKDEDVYWCTADIGWVTGPFVCRLRPARQRRDVSDVRGRAGHARAGPLLGPDRAPRRHDPLHGADGHPRLHEVGHGVARRSTTSRRCGCSAPSASRSTPRRGSGIRRTSAAGRCPIVDTWWQTETGAIMITPLPGVTTTRPGSATQPFPGIQAKILDQKGKRGRESAAATSRSRDPGRRCCGRSGATTSGTSRPTGRSGARRLLPRRRRQARQGRLLLAPRPRRRRDERRRPSDRDHGGRVRARRPSRRARRRRSSGSTTTSRGTAIAAFVILKEKGKTGEAARGGSALTKELAAHVAKKIGAIAKPDRIFFTADLPKTRSGKIMRRLLRDIAEGRVLGDTTTLADPGVVASLKDQYEARELKVR